MSSSRAKGLTSGVKWQGALKQKGINQMAVKVGLGVLTFPEANSGMKTYINQKHFLSRYNVKSEGYIFLHIL